MMAPLNGSADVRATKGVFAVALLSLGKAKKLIHECMEEAVVFIADDFVGQCGC